MLDLVNLHHISCTGFARFNPVVVFSCVLCAGLIYNAKYIDLWLITCAPQPKRNFAFVSLDCIFETLRLSKGSVSALAVVL